MLKNKMSLLAAQKDVSINKEGQSSTPGSIGAADMSGEALRVGLLKRYRRAGMDTKPDIFDELDKGLGWCQGQCEHATHQFLRNGDCSTEIANIKRKPEEVKQSAEKEMKRIKQVKAANPTPQNLRTPDTDEEGNGRVLKATLMRKE